MKPDCPGAIHHQIVNILHHHCGIETRYIVTETRLQEDLGLDSMGLLTLALEIENHWQLYLAEPPNHPPQTLGELVMLVQKRLQEQHDITE